MHKKGSGKDHLTGVPASDYYCVHITSFKNKKCKCEAYICTEIPTIDEEFDIEVQVPDLKLEWIPALSKHSEFLFMAINPALITMKIVDFDPDITYDLQVYYSSTNNETYSAELTTIPGHRTEIASALVVTNRGYGKFSIPINEKILGGALEFDLRDNCGNILTEKVTIPILPSEGRLQESQTELSPHTIEELQTLIDAQWDNINKENPIYQDPSGWTISNENTLKSKDKAVYQLYNKRLKQYYLVSKK